VVGQFRIKMNEEYRITERGMIEALEILIDGGYLTGEPGDFLFETQLIVKDACDRYIADSVAKGESRTNEECRDAFIIGYFHAYLEDVTKRVN
jgi:hypothetical protein